MARGAGRSIRRLIFRVPLACAPGGSALPLGQLENGTALEDAAFLDLEIQEHAGDAVPALVVFQQPEIVSSVEPQQNVRRVVFHAAQVGFYRGNRMFFLGCQSVAEGQ